MLKKIKEWLLGPYQPQQTQIVAANTVAVQAQGDVNVSGVPYKVTLPTTTDPLAVKEWPFPGYKPGEEVGKKLAEAAKEADAAAKVKKPRKPRAKKAKE